ncbi:hypothetical protein ACROYT_G004678 [Oculina patagonica]
MHLELWILAVVCTTVHGIGRISQPDLKAVNFAKAIAGHKLNGSVIKEIEVDSESFCRFECVEEERCQSLNFGTTENNAGRYKCQLCDSDRFTGSINFTKDEDFNYRGIKSACETGNSPCGDKGVCIPNYQDDSLRCKCNDGYAGKPCNGGKPMQVFCDMTTDGGGWTVFQKRLDGSVDFYLGWRSYKNGFGDLNGEFWLGNDNLHRLTAADDVMLRVDLEDFDGNITYAKYTTFKVADEGDKYRLLIGGYNGTAGDSMGMNALISANNMQFSTKDKKNDLLANDNCAQMYEGAWWYRNCHDSNLNGLYLNGPHSKLGVGVNWLSFRGYYYSLKPAVLR